MVQKQENTGSRIIVVLIVLLCMAGIGVYFYMSRTNKNHASDNSTVSSVEKLYKETAAYDLDNLYPATPEEVVGMYLKTSHLLFRDYETTDEMITALLTQQRKLFSPELLAYAAYDYQLEGLKKSIALFKEREIFSIGTEQKPPIYYDAQNRNVCVVRALQYLSDKDNSYRNYYVAKNPDNGRWEISTWEETDENYKAAA